jgi:predicted nuclease of predicted toxin-antitoxin system
MKLLLDMNLSPNLAGLLGESGHEAIHWSDVGNPRATDREIMDWARGHQYTVVTHDLDLSAILAATNADFPSVVQVRTQDVAPEHIGPLLVSALERHGAHLTKGALVTLDEYNVRARILPIHGP